MRLSIISCVALALAACSPAANAPGEATASATVETGTAQATAEAGAQPLVGHWSFDRSCGLYDLVLNADGSAEYYNYSDSAHVESYAGRWRSAADGRVELTMHLVDQSDAPVEMFTLTLSGPAGEDLNGRFEGGLGGWTINARRCSGEDRD